jgi:hypothetical protein
MASAGEEGEERVTQNFELLQVAEEECGERGTTCCGREAVGLKPWDAPILRASAHHIATVPRPPPTAAVSKTVVATR